MRKDYLRQRTKTITSNTYPGNPASPSPERREGLTSNPESWANPVLASRSNVVNFAVDFIEGVIRVHSVVNKKDTNPSQEAPRVATDSKLDKSGSGRNALQTSNATSSINSGVIPSDVSEAYLEASPKVENDPVDPLALARQNVEKSYGNTNYVPVNSEDLKFNPDLHLGA